MKFKQSCRCKKRCRAIQLFHVNRPFTVRYALLPSFRDSIKIQILSTVVPIGFKNVFATSFLAQRFVWPLHFIIFCIQKNANTKANFIGSMKLKYALRVEEIDFSDAIGQFRSSLMSFTLFTFNELRDYRSEKETSMKRSHRWKKSGCD